mmetsp:Transcript_104011/g.333376  ORF Transcript_104011/g.333376 Transcript_104011/m.333376 type:complete len:140 (-) Transcript_104011:54-473(-)
MLPILASVATETLTDPLGLLLPATVACSFAFMLPAATPPNSVVFATRRLSIRDFLKAGIILKFVASVFGSVLIYLMGSAVYGVDDPFPEWACQKNKCRWVSVPGSINGVQVSSQACALTGVVGMCRLVDGVVLWNFTAP